MKVIDMENIPDIVKRLFEEVKKAQDENRNQEGFRLALQKEGFDFEPFTRSLVYLIKIYSNYEKMDVMDEIAKVIFLRVEHRIQNPGRRVKETGNSDGESTWNEIKNDELARMYAMMNTMWDCDDKEIFRKVWCIKDLQQKEN